MVSIIIPTYNRQNYISETLDSILNQTYPHWECIIVDDGSEDETIKVVTYYCQLDNRFRLYPRPSEMLKGANSCRNLGYLKSDGEYIKFLDSDDLLTQNCLEKQVKILEDDCLLQVCLSYGRYFDNESKNLKELWSRNMEYPDFLLGHIKNQIRWAISDPLWRKSFFKTPPFKEGLMNSQEWLMHGRAMVMLKDDEISNIKETLSFIRKGNLRMSSEKSSAYHKNQKLARWYLLKFLATKRLIKPSYYLNLIKQYGIYYFWQLKKKI